MKIGILGSRGIPNAYGGFEQFAEYLSYGLVRRGADVWVYCSSNHPYKAKSWKGVNLIHCHDPEARIGTAGQFIYDLNCIRDAQKRNFDIIYQLGYTSSSVWYRFLPEGPAVLTNMDGLEWKRNKYNRIIRKFLRYAEKLAVISSDVLIADSPAMHEYLNKTYEVSSEYITYGAGIFGNPDQSKISDYNLTPYGYLLLIARMQPDNNIETVIRGFVASGSNLPLVIVGSTDNKFGAHLKGTYPYRNIRFTGSIFNQETLNNLRYHSAMYFHGHSAGGTNPSLLEAMASSALICAHNNPFNRAVLGENAFYFSNEQDVADVIRNYDSQFRKQHSFVAANLQTIKENHNWDKIIDDYHKLFSEII